MLNELVDRLAVAGARHTWLSLYMNVHVHVQTIHDDKIIVPPSTIHGKEVKDENALRDEDSVSDVVHVDKHAYF
eukprot:2891113-Karenia_brevis.AAC.1